jgi:hypothetical protein
MATTVAIVWFVFIVLVVGAAAALGNYLHTQQPSRAVALGLLVALLIASLGANDVVKSRELSKLLDEVEASEAVMESWKRSLSDFIDTRNDLQRSINQGFTDLEDQKIPANTRMRQSASSHLTDLLIVIHAIDNTSNAPWHGSVTDARATYQTHTSAWADQMEAWSNTDATLSEVPNFTAEIGATFAISEIDFDDALPVIPLFGLKSRVAAVFES